VNKGHPDIKKLFFLYHMVCFDAYKHSLIILIMGCMMSQERKRASIIAKSKTERYHWKDHCQVDNFPVFVGDSYYISLKPQELILEFKVYNLGDRYECTMNKVQHVDRVKYSIDILSDQILIPLIALCRLDLEETVVRYMCNGTTHIRIAENQYNRSWRIASDRLLIWPGSISTDSWKIELSDIKAWSTMRN